MNVWKVLKNTYYDSVTLMSLTARLKKEMPFKELVMLMGTDMNKEMIRDINLMSDEIEKASPGDLVLAASLEDTSLKDTWDTVVLKQLNSRKSEKGLPVKEFKTINQAKKEFDANVAVISVPGIYASNEALNALKNNMHVMLFSDNVSIEDEIELKKAAIERDLLLMGPDCGTAILNGIGLCFANNVRQGNIGLVAASGTGLQEVTVIIDRFGGGITQAIGVGGRDLSEQVGGAMMLKGIDMLDKDEKTAVIVLISKPPHKSVEEKIMKRLESVKKPVVVCFLDKSEQMDTRSNITFTTTLAQTAVKALNKAGIHAEDPSFLNEEQMKSISEARAALTPSQTKIKGLFCGGTLTAEALSIVRKYVKEITSNVAKREYEKMKDVFVSSGNNLVDLGDDIFTQERPHPMIEPTIRLERIIKEAENPETGVLLLDFVLGYGSHEDPVGITVDTLKQAKEIAQKHGRHLPIVAYICGTENDKQSLKKQEQQLRDLGVIVAKSNANACLIAAEIIKEI
ncbi:MAG: acyl-CoA synthetase FdrA [Bacillota bacterium]